MRFRSDPATIRGSIAPVVTPFTADGALDVEGLRGLVRWQLASGSHGISIGGSTGEPSSMSVDERIQSMRIVAEETADKVPFMPGTGSAKLDETFKLTAAAQELGADAALVITPYYARPTQDGLYNWYSIVAQEFPDMPIVIYNVPSRTAIDIAPETVGRLRRDFANIVGVKETTRDFEHFSKVFYAAGRDTLVWSGIELLCLPLYALGGIGFISAAANVAPAAVAQMFNAVDGGDHKAALDLHYAMHPIVDLIFVDTNPAPAKFVLNRAGLLGSGFVRPPLVEPAEASQKKILALLAEGASVLDDKIAAVLG